MTSVSSCKCPSTYAKGTEHVRKVSWLPCALHMVYQLRRELRLWLWTKGSLLKILVSSFHVQEETENALNLELMCLSQSLFTQDSALSQELLCLTKKKAYHISTWEVMGGQMAVFSFWQTQTLWECEKLSKFWGLLIVKAEQSSLLSLLYLC